MGNMETVLNKIKSSILRRDAARYAANYAVDNATDSDGIAIFAAIDVQLENLLKAGARFSYVQAFVIASKMVAQSGKMAEYDKYTYNRAVHQDAVKRICGELSYA